MALTPLSSGEAIQPPPRRSDTALPEAAARATTAGVEVVAQGSVGDATEAPLRQREVNCPLDTFEAKRG